MMVKEKDLKSVVIKRNDRDFQVEISIVGREKDISITCKTLEEAEKILTDAYEQTRRRDDISKMKKRIDELEQALLHLPPFGEKFLDAQTDFDKRSQN
jgi:uncharacterized protein with ATP-grasp and redox domains